MPIKTKKKTVFKQKTAENFRTKAKICLDLDRKLKNAGISWCSIFDSIGYGIVVLDRKGTIVFTNKNLYKLGNYSKEEVVGKKLAALKMLPLKTIAKLTAAFLQRLIGKESAEPYEVEMITKEGAKKIIEVVPSPLVENGKIIGDVAILRDVAERKELEKKLTESEERFRTIFEKSPDAYFLIDLRGNFIDGNEAAEKISGYKKEELLGQNMAKVLPFSELAKATKRLGERVLGKSAEPLILEMIKKDGNHIAAETNGSLVEINGKKLFLGVVRDVTLQKKIEVEIKKKNEELEKFNKFAVGREVAMANLKKRIRELEEKLGIKSEEGK